MGPPGRDDRRSGRLGDREIAGCRRANGRDLPGSPGYDAPRETAAAILASRTLEITTDPVAREALAVIARDEAAHAELAFRFLAWAARDDAVRRELASALPAALEDALRAEVAHEITRDDALLGAHGQPGGALRRAAVREAVAEVARPCLAAILAPTGAIARSAPRAEPLSPPRFPG
jgi:hypothetical protein